MKTYEITQAVRTEHRIGQEVVANSYEPGTVTARSAAEEKSLDLLVAQGLAAPKKRSSKASEERQS